jgi:hypothetical protein
MSRDAIVEDTRTVREQHAARFKYDLDAIYRDLKQQEQRGNRAVVTFSPKPPTLGVRKSAAGG